MPPSPARALAATLLLLVLSSAACTSTTDDRPLGTTSAEPGTAGTAGASGTAGSSGAAGTSTASAGAPTAGGAGSVSAAGSGGTGLGSAGATAEPDRCAGKAIDDANPCTNDRCDPATGIVFHETDLDDGNMCTEDSCDLTLGVVHTPIPLGDQDPCTIDSCDPKAGVKHEKVAGCAPCLSVDACDDGNPCTVETCDPITSCGSQPRPDGTLVSDGNLCNGPEICVGGLAQPGKPVEIDDADPCTVDSCDPKTGVITHAAQADCPHAKGFCAGAELPSACPEGKTCGRLEGGLFDGSRGCMRWAWLTCADVCSGGEFTSCFTIERADGSTDYLRFPNSCQGTPELAAIGVTLGCPPLEGGPWPECP